MNNNETAVLQLSMINLDRVYPVGSIYFSVSAISPNELFGGVWEQIKDCFLLACGDKFAYGTTGGSEKETLSVAQLPAHNHIGSTKTTTNTTTSTNGNHTHNIMSGYGGDINGTKDAFRYQFWGTENGGPNMQRGDLVQTTGNHNHTFVHQHTLETNNTGGNLTIICHHTSAFMFGRE